MAVEARFYVAEITRRAYGGQWAEPAPYGDVVLRPSTKGEQNKDWASATPVGEFKMTVNGPAFPWFDKRLGKDIRILMDDVPEE